MGLVLDFFTAQAEAQTPKAELLGFQREEHPMSEVAGKQYCANCGSPDVRSGMVTDKFLYGVAPDTVVLAAEVLMFKCVECGESYTGEQGELARMSAVAEHLRSQDAANDVYR